MRKFEIYREILSIYLNFYYGDQRNSKIFRQFGGVFAYKIWQCFYLFLTLITKSILNSRSDELRNSNKVWAFVLSHNNYRALNFLHDYQSELDLVFVAFDHKNVGNGLKFIKTYNRFIYSIYFLKIWFLFFKKYKSFAMEYFNLIFYSIGYYEILLRKLKKYKPEAIIFANDHNINARALLLAAKRLSIKTIYIQHAAVSKYFPKLIFDLSLLEGEVSNSIYVSCGVESKVKLVGMPKFDEYVKLRKSNVKKIIKVGITVNLSDNRNIIYKLIKELVLRFPNREFTLRPHPLLAKVIKPVDQLGYSDPIEESAFDFLQKQDLIIAANSSILLEATMLNVLGIYFNSGSLKFDYYGFVKHGLVSNASSIEEVCELVEKSTFDEQHYLKAKPFNYLIGTIDEGNSKKIAINYIKEFICYKSDLT